MRCWAQQTSGLFLQQITVLSALLARYTAFLILSLLVAFSCSNDLGKSTICLHFLSERIQIYLVFDQNCFFLVLESLLLRLSKIVLTKK